MKAYSIFDDYTAEARDILENAGVDLTVHPVGIPRPDHDQMKEILEQYDCVIIGTSQKITEDMFDNISSLRIIATASVGLDHIRVPNDKEQLITIINTPKANAQSVAEYTIGCALMCCKRLVEGNALYREGKNNKKLAHKPEDLAGKTLGVVGAGNISRKIMEYGKTLGMDVMFWTAHPEKHEGLPGDYQPLDDLLRTADVISVNIPNNEGTKGLINKERIGLVKDDAIFISVSRVETVDYTTLFERAKSIPSFYVCLDIDVNDKVVRRIPDNRQNIVVTPHIAGGTVETRKRMFRELAEEIVARLINFEGIE